MKYVTSPQISSDNEPFIWIKADKADHLVLIPLLKNKTAGFQERNLRTITRPMIEKLNDGLKHHKAQQAQFVIKTPEGLNELNQYFDTPLPSFPIATIVLLNGNETLNYITWIDKSPEESLVIDQLFTLPIFNKKFTRTPLNDYKSLTEIFTHNKVIEQQKTMTPIEVKPPQNKTPLLTIQKMIMEFESLPKVEWEKHDLKGCVFTINDEENIKNLQNTLKEAIPGSFKLSETEKKKYLLELESNIEEVTSIENITKYQLVCSHDLLIKLFNLPTTTLESEKQEQSVLIITSEYLIKIYLPALLAKIYPIFNNDPSNLSVLFGMMLEHTITREQLFEFMRSNATQALNNKDSCFNAVSQIRQFLAGNNKIKKCKVELNEEEIKLVTFNFINDTINILQSMLIPSTTDLTQSTCATEQSIQKDKNVLDSVTEEIEEKSAKRQKTHLDQDEITVTSSLNEYSLEDPTGLTDMSLDQNFINNI